MNIRKNGFQQFLALNEAIFVKPSKVSKDDLETIKTNNKNRTTGDKFNTSGRGEIKDSVVLDLNAETFALKKNSNEVAIYTDEYTIELKKEQVKALASLF